MYTNLQLNGKWEIMKTAFLFVNIYSAYISKEFMIPLSSCHPHQLLGRFLPKTGMLTTPPHACCRSKWAILGAGPGAHAGLPPG